MRGEECRQVATPDLMGGMAVGARLKGTSGLRVDEGWLRQRWLMDGG